jgi:hypothetical protein
LDGGAIEGDSHPLRALTVSSTSLTGVAANSDAHSIHSATGASVAPTTTNNSIGDPLDERFEQLSVRIKETRSKDKAASMLISKK